MPRFFICIACVYSSVNLVQGMEQLRGCIALLKVVHERHDKFAALVLVFGAVSALYYIVGSLG